MTVNIKYITKHYNFGYKLNLHMNSKNKSSWYTSKFGGMIINVKK